MKQKLLNALICTLENVPTVLLLHCFYFVLSAEVFYMFSDRCCFDLTDQLLMQRGLEVPMDLLLKASVKYPGLGQFYKGTFSCSPVRIWIESKRGNSDQKKLQILIKVFKTCHRSLPVRFCFSR